MKIKDAEVGMKVIYAPEGTSRKEEGVITSFNDRYIFVRYGNDTSSKATRPEDIEFIGGKL